MSYFGEKFKQACQERGTSHYHVALDVGFDPAIASQIVNDKRKPKHEHLEKLATSNLIDVSYHTLLSWVIIDQFPKEAILEASEQVSKSEG